MRRAQHEYGPAGTMRRSLARSWSPYRSLRCLHVALQGVEPAVPLVTDVDQPAGSVAKGLALKFEAHFVSGAMAGDHTGILQDGKVFDDCLSGHRIRPGQLRGIQRPVVSELINQSAAGRIAKNG